MQLKLSKTGEYDLLAIEEDGKFIGFFGLFKDETMAYLFYFAIAKAHRCKGYGSRALQLLKEYYPHTIVVDFERVDEKYDNYRQRLHRRGFYMRNGFVPSGMYVNYLDMDFDLYVIGTWDAQHYCRLFQCASDLLSDITGWTGFTFTLYPDKA